ncbi:hypothetical protein M011DRAFT_384786, partial [Sporormia fimetaria CBS 119925]
LETPDIDSETPSSNTFIPPSIHTPALLSGSSYTHSSPLPSSITSDPTVPCILGVDEAGRGPVLGPMVYALFYLPLAQHHSLLAETHEFQDSKITSAATRSDLMRAVCTSSTDLYENCGWATRVMSARDISAGMLGKNNYNLNAQAMDATIALIQGVLDAGVNVTEIYIDTIGRPETYQKKLERIWPTIRITVAKKADSIYPVVSAASVCAKVTRDAGLEVCWEAEKKGAEEDQWWGSGYPGDARTKVWLKRSKDPVFGWGSETRFSWGTAKEMLEGKGEVKVEWAKEEVEEENGLRMTDFFSKGEGEDELVDWFGKRVTEEMEVF